MYVSTGTSKSLSLIGKFDLLSKFFCIILNVDKNPLVRYTPYPKYTVFKDCLL